MTATNCPFSLSTMSESCFLLKQRNELKSSSICAFDSKCRSVKKIISNDSNESITLIKNALVGNIPEMVMTAPIIKLSRIYDTGGEPMEGHIEDLKNTTRAELEKRLIDSNRVTNNALSIISDLIHLNIATVKKSIEDTNEAMHELLNASDLHSLASSLTSQQATARDRVNEYTKNLSTIAFHARENNAESVNTNMTYLVEKMQRFFDQIDSTDPTWLNYKEHFKTNLTNAQSAYAELAKKMHNLQDNQEKKMGRNE